MSLHRLLPLVVVPALVAPASAAANWTAASPVPLSTDAMWPTGAVNGRGDLAVAWIQESRSAGHATVRVRAAFRPAGATRLRLRTLVSQRDLAARGTAVALDARGELTVAWVQQASDNGRTHGPRTIRAAFRTPSGRWSRTRSVGRTSAFNYAAPRLAATPGGTVVLTYNARSAAAPGVAAAWRSRGARFGAVQPVPTGRGYLNDPTLAFDPAGRAFLTGTQGCDTPTASAVVFTAAPRSRRFGGRTTVSASPAKAVRLAVIGRGAAAVAWLTGKCSTTEDTGGAPVAAVVRDGVAGDATSLATGSAAALVAAGAPGGAEVSFVSFPSTTPSGALLTARLGSNGTFEPALPAPDGWIALAADAQGDQLAGRPNPAGGAITPLGARAAGQTALEPAPVPAAGFPWTAGTVGAPDGRALAVVSFAPLSSMHPHMVVSVWRP